MVVRRRGPALTTYVVSVLASGLLVAIGTLLKTTSAGFMDTTTNGANAWAAGSVNVTDDDAGSAMFNLSGLNGGDSYSRCIRVTYNGTILSGGANTVDVRMYASATGGTGDSVTTAGDLRDYLDITVERGTAGTFSATCAGFTTESVLTTTTTLKNFTTGSSYVSSTNGGFDTYAHGALPWTPGSSGAFKVYKITATVQNTNAAQFKSATATFTWEAQSAGSNSTPATGANSMP